MSLNQKKTIFKPKQMHIKT